MKFKQILSMTIGVGLLLVILLMMIQTSDALPIPTTSHLVSDWQKIAHNTGGFGPLIDDDQFGRSLGALGDFNQDGIPDFIAGVLFDDTGGLSRGAVYLMLMNRDGTVYSNTQIAHNTGGFGPLDNQDYFGSGVAGIGDLNQDGVIDIVVGAHGDDTNGSNTGAVYILFMNANGTVSATQKIANNTGGFDFPLQSGNQFGIAVTPIGDLDDDGITELAVGANHDSTGGTSRGAVYILFMNSNGTVKSTQKIAHNTGGFGALSNSDWFGFNLAGLGDVNKDGVPDLAVAALQDDTGGTDRGALYILFLQANGTVSQTTKIAHNMSGFGQLNNIDRLGTSIDTIGDLNRDTVPDIVAGAARDDTNGSDRGAAYIIYLASDGTANHVEKIADNSNGFGSLNDFDVFGGGSAYIGDLNADCIIDIAIGAHGDNTGGNNRGAVYTLFLTPEVTATADLQLNHTLMPTTAWAGNTITYTLQFTNNGLLTATNIIISDTLPPKLITPIITLPNNISMTTIATTPITIWQLPTLLPNESHTLTVTGQLSDTLPPMVMTSTTNITNGCYDGDLSNNSVTSEITIIEPPSTDLQLTKSARPITALPNDTITYTLAFTNVGNTPWHNILITDVMPTAITDVQVILPTNITITAVTTQTPYIWQVTQLLPNQSSMIQIIGQIDGISSNRTITNTAAIANTRYDPNNSNNRDTAVVTVKAPAAPLCQLPTTHAFCIHMPIMLHTCMWPNCLPLNVSE